MRFPNSIYSPKTQFDDGDHQKLSNFNAMSVVFTCLVHIEIGSNLLKKSFSFGIIFVLTRISFSVRLNLMKFLKKMWFLDTFDLVSLSDNEK